MAPLFTITTLQNNISLNLPL